MPSRPTIYYWLKTKPDFEARYSQAVDMRVEGLMDGLTEMSDNVTPSNFKAIKEAAAIQQWILTKQLPHKYGNRQYVTQQPLHIMKEQKISIVDFNELSAEAREKLRELADLVSEYNSQKQIEA